MCSGSSVLSENHTPSRGYLNKKNTPSMFLYVESSSNSWWAEDAAVPSFTPLLYFRVFVIRKSLLYLRSMKQKPCGSNLVFSSVPIVFAETVGICVCVCVWGNTLSLSARIEWLPYGCATEVWQAKTAAHYLPCQPPPASWSWQCWSNFPATPSSKNHTASLAWALAGEGRREGGNKKKQTETTTASKSALQ